MKNELSLSLNDWIHAAKDCAPDAWETLPQIDLYMDQVITLMNRHAEVLCADSDRPLTSSMINNYVKDEVMPRPVQKKYNREHLTALSIIRMLKAEFTLPQIRLLMQGLREAYDTEEIYAAFTDAQNYCLQDAVTAVEAGLSSETSERFLLAMSLALEANAKRLAAAKLLEELGKEP